jgi:hypothetical protein
LAQDRKHASDFAAEAHGRRAYSWIRRVGTAHSSSWATRTGRSPCRL